MDNSSRARSTSSDSSLPSGSILVHETSRRRSTCSISLTEETSPSTTAAARTESTAPPPTGLAPPCRRRAGTRSTQSSGFNPERWTDKEKPMRMHRDAGFRLLVASAIAVISPLLLVAQQGAFPPNGSAFPVIKLTGGGDGPPGTEPAPGPIDKPSAWNMEVVGHEDLQGRSAYQPTIVNQDGRFIAYVGHHDNQKPIMNPMTGQAEINGTSVVEG